MQKRTSEVSRGLSGLPAGRLRLPGRGPRAFAKGKALQAGGISAAKTLDTTMVQGAVIFLCEVLASFSSRISATFIFSRFEAFIRRFTFVAAHSFAGQRPQPSGLPAACFGCFMFDDSLTWLIPFI